MAYAIQTPRKTKDVIAPQDRTWVESLTYAELMEHFRCARLGNKFHNGALGKLFSDTVDARRAELTPEAAAQVDAEAAQIPKTIEGTRH